MVTGTPQSREAYGCSMRKDDRPFKALVDRTIASLETSGGILPIYEKWLQSPSAQGAHLDFPLSDEIRPCQSPNDKALD